MSRPLTLRLTETAEGDLADIWSYVAAEVSPAMATRLVEKIESACQPLLDFPFAGPARDQLAKGLRVTFEGNYAIYYTHDDHELVVIRVLHSARDIATLADAAASNDQVRPRFSRTKSAPIVTVGESTTARAPPGGSARAPYIAGSA